MLVRFPRQASCTDALSKKCYRIHKTGQNKKRRHKKRTRDLCNTRLETQIQTKLDQPPRKNGHHQTPKTRPHLQSPRKKGSRTLQETMATRRCRNRSNDLIHWGRWWWWCWWSVFGEWRSGTSVPGGIWTFIFRLADPPQITTTHFRKQYQCGQSVCDALSFAWVANGKVPCIYAEGAGSIRYHHWNNTPGRGARRSRKQKNVADQSTLNKRAAMKRKTHLSSELWHFTERKAD